MRTPDGRLIADLNDKIPALVTGSMTFISASTIDENLTKYSLLPESINARPYESESVYNLSTPQIKPIEFNDPDKQYLYINGDGTIKVAAGTNFTLKFLAIQPPIENVENGLLVTYSGQEKLLYEWQKDGETFYNIGDLTRENSTAIVTGSIFGTECVFENISPQHAGIYTCTVSNDIGSITSEQIYIEVDVPDENQLFYKNLIQNPDGASDTDQWLGDQDFITRRLNNGDFLTFSQPWKTDTFGYTKDMFYPRPYHLNTYYIKNSTLEQNVLQDGYYFTRDTFKYFINGGEETVTAICDVDVSEAKDYIQGSIYGVEGVSAVFGCYIGNAVSAYKVTLLNALLTARSSKYTTIPNQIRLSLLNALLAGVPMITEDVKVTIQEYDNETPLITDGYANGYDMYDDWNKTIWTIPEPVTLGNKVVNEYGQDVRILKIANDNVLVPSQSFLATYGQYVKHNKFIINKLNYKTTKVRITIRFQANHGQLSETNKSLVESDQVIELPGWEPITLPFKLPRNGNYVTESLAPYPESVSNYNIRTYKVNYDEVERHASFLGQPRGMATGFNLVLFPIETKYPNKTEYFKQTILSQIDNANQDGSYNVNNLTYPSFARGVAESTNIGIYLAELASLGYSWDIVGVGIYHELNIPTADTNKVWKDIVGNYPTTRGTWRYGDGVGPTSITKIKTFLYNTNNVGDSDTSFTNKSAWSEVVLSDLSVFQNNTIGTVVYNPTPNEDITGTNIDQVLGNVVSGIAKYTNNMVTVVPSNFTTESFSLQTLRPNLGFNLELEGVKYGINKTEYNKNNKEQLVNEWKTYSGSLGIKNFYYRLLGDVSKHDQGYQPATRKTQYVTYNRTLYNNLMVDVDWSKSIIDLNNLNPDTTAEAIDFLSDARGASPTVGAWHDLYIAREYRYPLKNAHVYDASSLFAFRPTTYYEYPAGSDGDRGYYSFVAVSANLHADNRLANVYKDDYVNSPMWNQWWGGGSWFGENNPPLSNNYLKIIKEADNELTTFRDQDTGASTYYQAENGKYVGLLTKITTMDGTTVDIRSGKGTTFPSYERNGVYSLYDYDRNGRPRIKAVFQTHGATNSRIALNKVTSTGTINTPAVIIEPTRKKITYFIYRYNSNVKNEPN